MISLQNLVKIMTANISEWRFYNFKGFADQLVFQEDIYCSNYQLMIVFIKKKISLILPTVTNLFDMVHLFMNF